MLLALQCSLLHGFSHVTSFSVLEFFFFFFFSFFLFTFYSNLMIIFVY